MWFKEMLKTLIILWISLEKRNTEESWAWALSKVLHKQRHKCDLVLAWHNWAVVTSSIKALLMRRRQFSKVHRNATGGCGLVPTKCNGFEEFLTIKYQLWPVLNLCSYLFFPGKQWKFSLSPAVVPIQFDKLNKSSLLESRFPVTNYLQPHKSSTTSSTFKVSATILVVCPMADCATVCVRIRSDGRVLFSCRERNFR